MAVYAGIPAANSAFKMAKRLYDSREVSHDPAARAYSDHPPFRYPDYKSTMKRSPDKDMVRILRTLSENTGPGPASHDARMSAEDADLTTNAGTGQPAIGERIIVTGRVLDEDGRALPGTLIEIWQTNASGRYAHWRESDFRLLWTPTSSVSASA